MDTLKKQDLLDLMSSDSPCVTLTFPTLKNPVDARQNQIRWRNLLAQAQQQCLQWGMSRKQTDDFLAKAHALASETAFWHHVSDGFAAFISRDTFRTFKVALPLPELCLVSDRFHIKPLLRCLRTEVSYFVLTLSQKSARLFRGTEFEIEEVEVEGLKKPTAERTPDEFFSKSGRQNSDHFFPETKAGDQTEQLLAYFHQIDAALRPVLQVENAPLIVASVAYLLPLYSAAQTYLHLWPQGISGNSDYLPQEELRRKAWALVGNLADEPLRSAALEFDFLAGRKDARVSWNLDEALQAAYEGRIERLIVPMGIERWGRMTEGDNGQPPQFARHATPQLGDFDLFDYAAAQTLSHGGHAYVVEPSQLPRGGELAAIFRY